MQQIGSQKLGKKRGGPIACLDIKKTSQVGLTVRKKDEEELYLQLRISESIQEFKTGNLKLFQTLEICLTD